MNVFAIGDVQGCYEPLKKLLARIEFNPVEDYVWFAGDLVNRGPDSLKVLRLVKSLGKHAITVLGNHDLHLLAVAYGVATLRRGDTLDEILEAPDRAELLEWLRTRPLLHHDPYLNFTLVHAGLPPQWDLATAQHCACEVESQLRSPTPETVFTHLYGNEPCQWSQDLSGPARWRFTINALTRMRYVDSRGRLNLQVKGAPGTQDSEQLPWFRHPERAHRDLRIIFGHWSTLGTITDENLFALDTACVWGGKLTALCLTAELERVTVECPAY